MLTATLYTLLSLALIVLVAAFIRLRSVQLHTTPPRRVSNLGQEVDLPSVSVCIPARNEQHALTDCLERVIASSYDKLEIIVLDDSSKDKTSALIRSFASEGVRFVEGAALPDGWLGKNHALQGLLNEASGTYILFLDVDTRISPQAIENLIRYTITQRASMVSVIPRRDDGIRTSMLFSSLRYFWELLFHRPEAPATASGAWIIRRKLLKDQFNGFQSTAASIQPEAILARELAQTQQHRLLTSSPEFGFSYEKKWRSQLTTSVRLLFPLLRSRPLVAVAACLGLMLFILPYVVVIYGILNGFSAIQFVALAVITATVIVYGSYTRHMWSHGWYIGALLAPYVLMQEIALIIVSLVKYKTHSVTWKGRVIQPATRN